MLTYTNKGANIINTIVTESLFKCCEPIARVQLDDDDIPNDIFSGMRIVITQNIDKKNGVVNVRT